MRIYVANLAAYNNGEMVGDWFDLPVEMEEVFENIFEPHELDENGQPHGDWAIHDYELPISIEEYTSIEKLNEFAERLESVESAGPILEGNYNMGQVIAFAREIGREDVVENIYENKQLDDIVAREAKEKGFAAVHNTLRNIRNPNAEYFEMDGYGNFGNIEMGQERDIAEELFQGLQDDIFRAPVQKEQVVTKDKKNDASMER